MSLVVTVTLALGGGALFGWAMKTADLLDEHGLRWFNGSRIVFGMLWGASGAALMWVHPAVAAAVFAMVVAFIIRGSLDFSNHRLAAAMIILAYASFRPVEVWPVIVALTVFLAFGYAEDISDKRQGLFMKMCGLLLYYPTLAFLYGFSTGSWLPFGVAVMFIVAYDTTKIVARRRGYV